MCVLELDRILDRDDVARVTQVDLVHERRQRRRLARAGGAADEHEAAGEPRQRLDVRRQEQRREARRHARQAADRRRSAAALVMEVDAEAAEIRRPIRAVGDAALVVLPPRVRRQRRQHGVLNLLAAERAAERRLERGDEAVDANRRRRAGDEQQIARRSFDDLLEPRAQPDHLLAGVRRLRRAGVQLADERVEVLVFAHARFGARTARAVQAGAAMSGALRNRDSGSTARNVASSVG